MTPKRSGKASARKTKSPGKKSAPKADSPMQQHNHVAGSNVDGMAAQARAAHELPSALPPAVAASVAPMNIPPSPTESASDAGQKE